jgi:PAS domain S-box-containing protein
VEGQLLAVADLKVGILMQWRRERRIDAGIFFKNPSFAILVRRFLEKPGDADAQRQLLDWLGKYPAPDNYSELRVLDAQGITQLSVPVALTPPSSVIVRGASEVLRSGQVAIQDFYRNEYDQRIYLAVLVPILDEQEGSRPLGVLVLRGSPETYLYPIIKRWPTPSQTAETLLVRREGNEAVFLNELRFQTNTALNLHTPLDRVAMPAVQAVLGKEGITEGVDYRGVPVIAALRAVPDSPWSLVARMDDAEVYGAMRERLWQTVVLMGSLLLGAGACMGLVWWQQRARVYRVRAEVDSNIRRMAAVVKDSNDAITIQDFEGRITAWNRGAELMYGYSESEALVMNIERLTAPGKVAEQKDFIRRLVAGEAVSSFETQRVTKGGRVLDVWMTVTKLVDKAGESIGIASTERDITQRKRTETALQQSGLTLQEKNAELERFLYTTSHDLKSPVVTVRTFLDYLEQDMAKPDAGRIEKDMRFIRTAADKMARLLDELLQISRIGRVVSPPVRITFRALMDETLSTVAGRIAERGVKVIVGEQDLTLHGDQLRLAEIWQNLVENACKFMGDQKEPRIEMGAEARGAETVFFVRDNGIGIDPHYYTRVFSLFEKLDANAEGTGLGLAIVKRIVELYRGKIWVESPGPGQGACFYFTLPGAVMGH